MRLIKNLLADFSKEFYDWIFFFVPFHQSTSDSGFENSKTPDRQPIQDVFISISRARLLVNGKTNPVPKCKRQIRKNLALYCKSSVISINVYLDQYMKYITALPLIEYYNNCVTFIGKLLCQYPERCLTMYLLHWSEMENVQRYSGVFATCSIPALLTFGPYQGPLNMLLKTTDNKHLDFVLEVRLSDCYSNQ